MMALYFYVGLLFYVWFLFGFVLWEEKEGIWFGLVWLPWAPDLLIGVTSMQIITSHVAERLSYCLEKFLARIDSIWFVILIGSPERSVGQVIIFLILTVAVHERISSNYAVSKNTLTRPQPFASGPALVSPHQCFQTIAQLCADVCADACPPTATLASSQSRPTWGYSPLCVQTRCYFAVVTVITTNGSSFIPSTEASFSRLLLCNSNCTTAQDLRSLQIHCLIWKHT